MAATSALVAPSFLGGKIDKLVIKDKEYNNNVNSSEAGDASLEHATWRSASPSTCFSARTSLKSRSRLATDVSCCAWREIRSRPIGSVAARRRQISAAAAAAAIGGKLSPSLPPFVPGSGFDEDRDRDRSSRSPDNLQQCRSLPEWTRGRWRRPCQYSAATSSTWRKRSGAVMTIRRMTRGRSLGRASAAGAGGGGVRFVFLAGKPGVRFAFLAGTPLIQVARHGERSLQSRTRGRLQVVAAAKKTFGSFDEMIQGSDVPVLVDFYATWCGPCQLMSQILAEVGRELTGRVKVVKIDSEKYPRLASKYGIEALPTLLLFHDGKLLDRMEGAIPKDQLLARMSALLSTIRA